ncbi:MAG: primosomal protein N', partial [Candidatus Omnitrophica bacterium]|nr:primosomal protein N' [Candidatus Omnitrophota bacterium]
MESPPGFADVALGMPQNEPYQYAVEPSLAGRLRVGQLVRVPLRAQTRCGYVVGFSSETKFAGIKPIAELLCEEPLISPELMELARRIARHYFASWGQAIEAMMPASFKKGKIAIKTRARAVETEVDWIHATPPHRLTPDQERAFGEVRETVDAGLGDRFLLHGVTGSGKTEIYLHLTEHCVAANRGVIILVPEISLTPQTTHRFQSRFGARVAVVHSRLSAGQRLAEWNRIRSGEALVVIGPRSAVFSPVRSLALIIMDEEYDDSYKQEETPRYEAGWVAEERSKIEKAVLVRAAATPILESYYRSAAGEMRRLELNSRIEERPMPEVFVVDMRQEKAGNKVRLFSVALEDAIRAALAQGEQAMLLMNRRGFAPLLVCSTCGLVMSCPRCRVSLVFHHDRQKMLCHTCSYTRAVPSICPGCQKGYVRFVGFGTEKVESEAARLFPG